MQFALICACLVSSVLGQGLQAPVSLVNVTAQGGASFINGFPYGLFVSNDTVMAFLEGNLGIFQYWTDASGIPTLENTYTVTGGAFFPAAGGVDDTLVVAATYAGTTFNTWTRPSGGNAAWNSEGTFTSGFSTYSLQLTADGTCLYQGGAAKNIKGYTVSPTPGMMTYTYTLVSSTVVPIAFGLSSVVNNLIVGGNLYHAQPGSVGPTPHSAVLYQYATTSGCGLTPLTPLNITIPVQFSDFKASADGQNLYVLGLDNQCTIAQGSRASDGAITFGPTYTSATTVPCVTLAISADGLWVFAGGQGGDVLSWSRDPATGNLTPLSCPIYRGFCPSTMTIWGLATSVYSTADLTVHAGCRNLVDTYIVSAPFSATSTPVCPTNSPTPHPTPFPTATPTVPTKAPTKKPTGAPTKTPTRKH